MSLVTWIEEAVTNDFDFSTTGIIEFKEACYKLYHLLNELMNSDSKRRQQLRKFKSITAFETAASLEKAYPDKFYNFNYRDVSISIVRFEKNPEGSLIGPLFYIAFYGFTPDVRMYREFINDMILQPITHRDIDPDAFFLKHGCTLYGGYTEERFNDLKYWFKIFVDMFISRNI